MATALVLLAHSAALADPPANAPAPCVNRGLALVRPIHDVALDAKTLRFCTGDDCWTLDRATNAVAAAPKVAPAPAKTSDPAGMLTDGDGTVLATADKTHVEFCRRGVAVKAACKRFKLSLKTPAVGVDPAMNATRTLGAVVYRGAAEPDNPDHGPSYVVAFDLVKGKQLGALAGSDVAVLDRGFVVDSERLYSAALKPVGKLAAHDEVWIKVGSSTDLIALRDNATGEVVLQDTRTAKVKARIPLGGADKASFFHLVASPDGATVYAIGSVRDEGDIAVIDVARRKLVTHASPSVCAPGTMRRT
jgi:DNA-binding beta-propeller fold protein YncE